MRDINSGTYSLCTPTVHTLLVWKIRTGKLRTYYYYYTIESTVHQNINFDKNYCTVTFQIRIKENETFVLSTRLVVLVNCLPLRCKQHRHIDCNRQGGKT